MARPARASSLWIGLIAAGLFAPAPAAAQPAPAAPSSSASAAPTMQPSASPSPSNDLRAAIELTKEAERLYSDGQLNEALAAAQKALAIRTEKLGKESPLTASSESDVGGLLMAKGDYLGSEPPLRHAVDVLRKAPPGSERDCAAALNNLSRLYRAKGLPSLARPLLEEAVQILEKVGGPDDPGLGSQLRSFGNYLYSQASFREAEKLLRRAVAIHEKAGTSGERELLRDLTALGFLFRSTGRYPQAEEVLRRALALADAILPPKHPDRADLLYAIAKLLRGARQFAKADDLYKEVLDVYRDTRGRFHPSVAEVLRDRAFNAHGNNDNAAAVAFQREANEIDDEYLDLLVANGTDQEKRAYEKQLKRSTDATISFHMNYVWRGISNQDAAELALLTILRRKGRVLDALSSGLARLRENMSPDNQRLLDELAAVRSSLAKLALKGPGRGDPVGYAAEIDRLYSREQALETELSSRAAAFRASSRHITLQSIRDALPEGSALVEMARYSTITSNVFSDLKPSDHDSYAAYILPKHGKVRFALLGQDATDVDIVVEQVRKAFAEGSKNFPDPASRLDLMIMRPIADALEGITNVFLSPDGSLNLVPFGALVDLEGHFRIQKYSFTYLTSGRDLLRFQSPVAPRQPAVIIANPTYNNGGSPPSSSPAPSAAAADSSRGYRRPKEPVTFSRVKFSDLPGTLEEASAITSIVPKVETLTGEKATEGALKSLHGPKILHIATHGFFLDENVVSIGEGQRGLELEKAPPPPAPGEEPAPQTSDAIKKIAADPLLRSGLALAGANARSSGDDDGVLTALEALSLDLSGTKLVVLSACETGVGRVEQGEGIYGLRRALVVAGAETQVMTLWKVDDRATRDLMTAYYAKLLKESAGRSEGMRAVQLDAIAHSATLNPYYWAAFIVSGAPSPIEFSAAEKAEIAKPVAAVTPGARGCACELQSMNDAPLSCWIGAPLLALALRRRRR